MLQMYPENITPENESFVKEVIQEQFSSPLKLPPWERGEWNKKSLRCGVIAKKIGIYPMWTKDGKRLLTTLLQVSHPSQALTTTSSHLCNTLDSGKQILPPNSLSLAGLPGPRLYSCTLLP